MRFRTKPRQGLLGIGLLAALSGCLQLGGFSSGQIDLNALQSAGQKIEAANQPVPEDQEVEMGRHMAALLLGASPLEQNPAAQRYVNQVGRWLTLSTARPQLDWHFGILADADINAFAAPGGYVFVTRGLLDLLTNEAELAGVLAHEITHVTAQHHLEAMRKENMMGAAADVGSMVGNNTPLSRFGSGTREFAQKVVSSAKQLYVRGLDKRDEFASDEEALRLMSRAGYDPYAFLAVMQKLESILGSSSRLALLLQTHPSPTARLEAMDKTLRTLAMPQWPALGEARFEQNIR